MPMNRMLAWDRKALVALYVALDVLATGAGMGVPIFCIALGVPVGWFITRRALLVAGRKPATAATMYGMLRATLVGAAITSAGTFLLMGAIWGPVAVMLFDPAADLAHFGIPMILYAPRASFIGWLVLMIAISPFLQLLVTLFTAVLTFLCWLPVEGQADTRSS